MEVLNFFLPLFGFALLNGFPQRGRIKPPKRGLTRWNKGFGGLESRVKQALAATEFRKEDTSFKLEYVSQSRVKQALAATAWFEELYAIDEALIQSQSRVKQALAATMKE